MDYLPNWTYTADNSSHLMVGKIGVTEYGGGYPVVSLTDAVRWNTQINAGILDADLTIDLPAFPHGVQTDEIRIVAGQGVGNAYNLVLSCTDHLIETPDGNQDHTVNITIEGGKIAEISCCNVGGIICTIITYW